MARAPKIARDWTNSWDAGALVPPLAGYFRAQQLSQKRTGRAIHCIAPDSATTMFATKYILLSALILVAVSAEQMAVRRATADVFDIAEEEDKEVKRICVSLVQRVCR
jgi:hypothetical protein